MCNILPASEMGGKTSLAEVPIPFPTCFVAVAGDWKTLNVKKNSLASCNPTTLLAGSSSSMSLASCSGQVLAIY